MNIGGYLQLEIIFEKRNMFSLVCCVLSTFNCINGDVLNRFSNEYTVMLTATSIETGLVDNKFTPEDYLFWCYRIEGVNAAGEMINIFSENSDLLDLSKRNKFKDAKSGFFWSDGRDSGNLKNFQKIKIYPLMVGAEITMQNFNKSGLTKKDTLIKHINQHRFNDTLYNAGELGAIDQSTGRILSIDSQQVSTEKVLVQNPLHKLIQPLTGIKSDTHGNYFEYNVKIELQEGNGPVFLDIQNNYTNVFVWSDINSIPGIFNASSEDIFNWDIVFNTQSTAYLRNL